MKSGSGFCVAGVKKGFTLIELLVVITIIGMLISMLLPSLSKARDKSKQLSCMVLLRQMQAASWQYATDNKEWMLPVYPWFNIPTNTPTTASWAEVTAVRQYLDLTPEKPVYYAQAPGNRICPDAAYTRQTINGDGSNNIRYSYGANYTEFMDWQYPDMYLYGSKPPSWVAYRVSRVKSASEKLAWADSLSPSIRLASSSGYAGEKAPGTNDQIAYRHDQGVNMAMFDGHGEYKLRSVVDSGYITTAQANALWYPYK